MNNIIQSAACWGLIMSSVLCSSAHAEAKTKWVQDEAFGFKIQVPSNYQCNALLEGTDKIHAFLSPDQNVAVRVRVIPFQGNQQPTPEQVEEIWRENVLVGAKKVGSQKDEMNGLKGTTFAYHWTFNNTPCIVGSFVTVSQDKAYLVWCLAPESMFQKRMPEMAAITNSFNLLNGNAKNPPNLATNTNNPPVTPPSVTPPAVPNIIPGLPATDPTQNDAKQWQGFVLDDCMIEFEIPTGYSAQQKEQGQSQWWDTTVAEAARVKMIIQSLDRKAGNTMESVVQNFLDQVKGTNAATLIKSAAESHPELPVHHISFNLDQGGGNVTVFRYAVIDAPGPVVVAISYVTPQANSDRASQMYDHMLASLKPLKAQGDTGSNNQPPSIIPPNTGGGDSQITPPSTSGTSTPSNPPNVATGDTTSRGAWLKLNQAAMNKDWETLVTCLDGEAVQKVILDRMVNEGSVDLTGLPEDPLERLSALLITNAKVQARMSMFAAEGEIFNIREENDEMHLIMMKLKAGGEAWLWMKKKNGRWVCSPN